MSDSRFSMGEAISFGWDIMRNNIGFLILLYFTAVLIQISPQIIGIFVAQSFPLITIALQIVSIVLTLVVSLGMIKVTLQYCDGIKGKLDDLFVSLFTCLKYICAYLMIILAIGIFPIVYAIFFPFISSKIGGSSVLNVLFALSFLSYFVFAIIIGIKISLFPYFIIDEEMGPINAIKESVNATRGEVFRLFLFWLLWVGIGLVSGVIIYVFSAVLMIINPIMSFIGQIALSLLILFPLCWTILVAYAYVYRTLAGKSAGDTEVTDGTMYINLGT